MSKPLYTVSVRNWYGWTEHQVTNHRREDFPGGAWLVLDLADGSTLTVPGIDSRPIRIGADYSRLKEQIDQVRAEVRADAAAEVNKLRAEIRARDTAVAAPMPPVPIHPPQRGGISPLNGFTPQ